MRIHFLSIILSFFSATVAAAQSTVHFTIDTQSDVHPISRWIYGINHPIDKQWTNVTFVRLGGDRWSAYNWTNNASNAGNDWHFQNDNYLGGGSTPGGALIPGLQNAYEHDAGALITIQMVGYVSADKNPPGDVRKSGADYLRTRFRPEQPTKNAPFTLSPDANSPVVYEDEFVNWVKTKFPSSQDDPLRPIFFDLDNEPALWPSTHTEVHPAKTTYAEMVEKTIAYSTAIKNVERNAIVYGPVCFGWPGFQNLLNAPDAQGRDFLDFYLQQMSDASQKAGRRLLDVLDVHWYPETKDDGIRITDQRATPGLAAVRMQTPRSLWDPTYTESSWITQYSTHGPIRLIPLLLDKIARNFPGTKLSFSEYSYGGGSDISGAIAEADALGIFGKTGVFSANEWPGAGREPYIAAACAMYRNFDGKLSSFGDTSIAAATDDPASTSVYASLDSKDAGKMILIAVNKSAQEITTEIDLKGAPLFRAGEVYRLTKASPTPVDAGPISRSGKAPLQLTMPPYSISTIRFTSGP